MSTNPNTPRRLIIWGPGDVGGTVLRDALLRDDVEVVGVRAFSPHKIGRDIGTLVGLDPVGVLATDSVEEILALDADCVLYAPHPRVYATGMFQEVDALMRSGKNVISLLSHHNPARTNWLSDGQTPTSVLSAVAFSEGSFGMGRGAEVARTAMRPVMRALNSRRMRRVLPYVDRAIDPLFGKGIKRFLRADDIERTGRAHGVTVLGSGAHPGFFVDQLALAQARLLTNVAHLRHVESFDISFAPEGLWGGIDVLGFGADPAGLNENHISALAGSVGYGDVCGNVGWALFGAGANDVKCEFDLAGVPAKRSFKASDVDIARGTTAALHGVGVAYLGDHRFYTNEECWYADSRNPESGADLPFTERGAILYSAIIDGDPYQLASQTDYVAHDGVRAWSGTTDVPANVVLDFLGPVCDLEPGIAAHDSRPAYRVESTNESFVGPTGRARVTVVGDDDVATAVAEQAAARSDIEVVADLPDCVIVTGSGHRVIVADALTDGRVVVADHAVDVTADATVHVTGGAGDVLAERLITTLARSVRAPQEVRFVDALDVSPGSLPSADDVVASIDQAGVSRVAVVAAGLLHVDVGELRFEDEVARKDAGVTHVIRRAYLGERLVLTHELIRYDGSANAFRGDDLPFGSFTAPQCFSTVIAGTSFTLRNQIQLTATSAGNPAAHLTARALLDAAATIGHARSGRVYADLLPRLRLDDRA